MPMKEYADSKYVMSSPKGSIYLFVNIKTRDLAVKKFVINY